jgi:two-component system NtrC family sensor kinase
MRIVGILLYSFMALVLAAGWAFLFWQSSSVDLNAVEAARGALAELRAIDSSWNQRLVAARPRPAPAADAPPPAPVAAPHAASGSGRYNSAYGRLEVRALALGNPMVGSALAPLKRALDERATLVAQHAAAPSEELFERAWLASTGPRLDLLARAIDRAYDDASTQAELFRVGLLYYSGFLLAVLAFLVWNLEQRRRLIDRINAELLVANETLEARVAERTQELSEALAKLKESEAMLIQSEKMSSLGQMVAGIAHEVNTPLAYVKSSLEAVRKTIPQSARLADDTGRLITMLTAEQVDEAALASQFAQVRALLEELRAKAAFEELERLIKDGLFGIGQISEVIGNLKDFSRLDRSKIADFNLHEGIDSAIRIAGQQLQNRVVKKEYGSIPAVTCSPSQINQVILNLLSNAAQATADGTGTITVRTAPVGATHVAVEVADNGSGISPDVLPKIFDPFFTTKAVGKGTGLGLSICYKIAQNHGGKLEVQSKKGAGTRFRLLLPVKAAAGP